MLRFKNHYYGMLDVRDFCSLFFILSVIPRRFCLSNFDLVIRDLLEFCRNLSLAASSHDFQQHD